MQKKGEHGLTDQQMKKGGQILGGGKKGGGIKNWGGGSLTPKGGGVCLVWGNTSLLSFPRRGGRGGYAS